MVTGEEGMAHTYKAAVKIRENLYKSILLSLLCRNLPMTPIVADLEIGFSVDPE